MKHKPQVWHTVSIKNKLAGDEVVSLVQAKLPKIDQIDWYWANRNNNIEISFRNKKDKTTFNKKPKANRKTKK